MSSFNPFELFTEQKQGERHVNVALTIAGSDSGGGAGIQADLKTFAACEIFGTSVLTLITAQNTAGVSDVVVLDESIVQAQLLAVWSDLKVRAVKCGALGSEMMIQLVAEWAQTQKISNLVVDPVMISKHGNELLPARAARVYRDALLPEALLVTPNRFEAQVLTEREVTNPGTMREAAKRIFDFGAPNVLVKGGHLDNIVRDIYYDGTGFVEFGADRIDSKRVHGSGCVFSAAITARLAHGDDLLDAIDFARNFISDAISSAPKIGKGISPVNPMHAHWKLSAITE